MHSAVEVIFPLEPTQSPPSSILPSSVHKSIFQKNKMKTRTPKPKPKQKTIENLAARSKKLCGLFSSHCHPNSIDVQQGRSTQQQHTTQSSPIRRAIHRLNVTAHKDFNKLITCKRTRHYENKKLKRFNISHHQLPKFWSSSTSSRWGTVHYSLGFIP